MKLPRHYRGKTLAPRPRLWYFTATLTSLVEDFVKMKPLSALAENRKSATLSPPRQMF